MSKIFRDKYYKCDNTTIKKQNLNCIHWSINSKTCNTSCSLNLFDNPTSSNCISCKKRESFSKKILEEDAKSNPYTQITINSEPQITLTNVKSYVKAETSQFFQGKVDDDIYNERKQICLACPFKVNNTNNNSDEIGWCTACGCGTGTERTKLSVKLRMPAFICPKGKISPAVGKGFSLKDAIDSTKGMIKVVSKVL